MTRTALTVAADTTSISALRVADLRPWGMGKYTGSRPAPTHDEIAWLAFTLYEARGRQHGHDVEDWLRAEQQLVRQGDQKS